MWGFFPIFWKLLGHRPALETLAQRYLWSLVFYYLVFALSTRNAWRAFLRQPRREWLLAALASALLGLNWGLYIYAVNTGRVMEGSLAYFINPLLNVAVGVVFFREAFPPPLRVAVACAALGVAAKILYSPQFPWIALGIAVTFCSYGVAKKLLRISPRESSVMEGLAGFVPALLAVIYFQNTSPDSPDLSTWLLFAISGPVTGIPLFLFAYAAQRVPYSVMGILQFVAPSLQFLIAIALYHEAFGLEQLVAFGFIWAGVASYLAYQVRRLGQVEIQKL